MAAWEAHIDGSQRHAFDVTQRRMAMEPHTLAGAQASQIPHVAAQVGPGAHREGSGVARQVPVVPLSGDARASAAASKAGPAPAHVGLQG